MALYLRKRLDNKAEIAVLQITETEQELMSITSVPTDELEEISLFRNESHRKQKLAVRALINEVFEEKMYLNHHDNGKPYLENCATTISITHTDKYVAIIIHDDEEVGIDIESLDRDFAVVEKKALSEEEIDDLDDEKKNEQLAIYWCAKEAIFKRMSQRLLNNDFTVRQPLILYDTIISTAPKQDIGTRLINGIANRKITSNTTA